MNSAPPSYVKAVDAVSNPHRWIGSANRDFGFRFCESHQFVVRVLRSGYASSNGESGRIHEKTGVYHSGGVRLWQ